MDAVVLHDVRPGGIHVVTINRPKAANALTIEVLEALGTVVVAISADVGARAVVITGSGEKAFVAGADIGEMRKYSVIEAEAFSRLGQSTFDRLAALAVPVIAAVNGFALGGGCELAMACDIVIAGSTAKFGQPEVALGLIPGFGGTQRLVRRAGLARALELCLTGRMIDVDEALAAGIVSRKVDGVVLDAAIAVATDIASKGPVAVRLCKRALHENADGALNAGLAAERSLFAACFATADHGEGMDAFLEKPRRAARFTGS